MHELPTIGIEEEFLVVDAVTGRAMPAAPLFDERRPELVTELNDCCIEWNSPICAGPGELLAAATEIRTFLAARAAASGRRVLGVGMHPISDDGAGISPGARNAEVARRFPWAARHEVSFGLHVHVGMPSLQHAVQASDALRPLIPLLVAVGANSSTRGLQETGAASLRVLTSGLFPRSGPPPRFGSEAGLRAYLGRLRTEGVIEDDGDCWWLCRPHVTHGTLECRMFDAQSDPRRSTMLASLVRMLTVASLAEGPLLPVCTDEVLAEEVLIAARDGVAGRLIRRGVNDRTIGDTLRRVVRPLLAGHPDRALVEELVSGLVAPGSAPIDPIQRHDVMRTITPRTHSRPVAPACGSTASPARR